MKPLFRWMGGKRDLLKHYEEMFDLPEDCEDFYDLFAGGFSVAMWAYDKFPKARIHINEFNPFLVGLHKAVRDNTEEFITAYKREVKDYLALPMEEELCVKGKRLHRERHTYYYGLRDELYELYQEAEDKDNLGVQFYAVQYLMQRISFGGAWQTTKVYTPVYATPPGFLQETEKNLDVEANIRAVAKFLNDERVHLYCDSYEMIKVNPSEKTIIFADPPYFGTEQKYDAPFGQGQQVELCHYLVDKASKGCKTIMTNAPWDGWASQLPHFSITDRAHTYTCGQGSGKETKELLMANCLKKD